VPQSSVGTKYHLSYSSCQTLEAFIVFFADVKRRKVDLPSGSKVSIESF